MMRRTLTLLAIVVALAAPACKGKTSAEDKLEKTVQAEEAIVAKIEGIKSRQAALEQKLAEYQARLEQVRNKRQQLEQQLGRRAPEVIRPGEPSS